MDALGNDTKETNFLISPNFKDVFSTKRNLVSARATGVLEKPSANRGLIYLLHHLCHVSYQLIHLLLASSEKSFPFCFYTRCAFIGLVCPSWPDVPRRLRGAQLGTSSSHFLQWAIAMPTVNQFSRPLWMLQPPLHLDRVCLCVRVVIKSWKKWL